ncbi:MAG: RagB/SusD family nutrient uptake outer membrane protein [Tannerellaceae bacterium]|jgi:hypothetical protein|nr:RagB/SusD family nutrient uptake outer membrane protein [Tannerellaceae bacterium]
MKKYILNAIAGCMLLSSCNDYLDKEPLDYITPDVYFSTSEQLAAYTIRMYQDADFKANNKAYYSLGVFKNDDNTDVQVSSAGSRTRWVPGVWTVPGADGGWAFNQIYNANYFFEKVFPKYKAGTISGNENDIDHYIGEMYMLRAVEYFKKLKTFGDFPIIRNTISSADKQALIDANQRRPMNEVARFIMADLDSAAYYMHTAASDDKGARNRLTRDAALIFKSRVALYAGSWLKNFKGTALVPGGQGWPGANMSYNSGFNIDIDSEMNFFLDEAMKTSKEIADKIPLVDNLQNNYSEGTNPYVLIFSDASLSKYPEVILWNATSTNTTQTGLGFAHAQGGLGSGYTRAYIESFLDKNGLPIYASDLYKGDETLADVKSDRDNRLVQFLKIKDEPFSIQSNGTVINTLAPEILKSDEYKSTTGYDIKKGLTMSVNDKTAQNQLSGIIEYRAAEAYLNYMEACFLRTGNINADADKYWKEIRRRAGVDDDYRKTIAATNMDKEAGLMSAYTAGKLVDATMYNIRRERACELMSEGFRWDDLRRWRSMDQLTTNHYIVEGFKLWGSMSNWYKGNDGNSLLTYIGDAKGSTKGNVSSPTLSDYLRPMQINENSDLYNGYLWVSAHYLSPVGMSQFNITSGTDSGIDYTKSPLYQNPGWPAEAGGKASSVSGF